MKKKKLITIFSLCIVLTTLFVVFLRINALKEESEVTKVFESNFGSNIAIYVEQTMGVGDYIQKNAAPTDDIYVLGTSTHCIGGGIVTFNNATHKLSYMFDQSDECYIYLDKTNAVFLTTQIESSYAESPETIQQINYNATNTVITSGNATYTEYRYISKTPDNYVWFNCEEGWPQKGSSQNGNHCEKWRIIGIMDTNTTGESEPLVKIIRDSLGGISWDYKKNKNGSSTSDYGSNDWSDAQAMMMMNPEKYLNQGYRVNNSVLTNTVGVHGREYKVNTETGKVYYTKTDGTTQSVMQMTYNENTKEWAGAYYNRANGCKSGATAAGEEYVCNAQNFSTTGLRDEAKKYIQVLNWKIGGHNTTAVTTENMYKYERGTSVVNTNRPTTWYGEIGLMYPTDWALATDLNQETKAGSGTLCKDTNLSGWNGSSACYNNWLYTNSWTWPITPRSDSVYYAFSFNNYLYYGDSVYHTSAVRPVLYLKASTLVFGGTGNTNDPYKLMI